MFVYLLWVFKMYNISILKIIVKFPYITKCLKPVGIFIFIGIFSIASLFIIFFLMSYVLDFNRVIGLNREIFSDIYASKQSQSILKIVTAVIGPIFMAPKFTGALSTKLLSILC